MKYSKLILAALAFCLLSLTAQQARAELMITPLRIVFGSHDRSATVTLINNDEAADYRIGWKIMTMDETGTYKTLPLDDKDPHSVPNMVIYSPRQVSLSANSRQSVRLSLRRPADLPPGEYRAHLVFEKLPKQDSSLPAPGNEKGMSMGLQIKLGFSIPVIVRSGDAAPPTIKIGATSFIAPDKTEARDRLQVILNRTAGKDSAYGMIDIYTEDGGKEKKVGEVNNVALYPEVDKRIVKVPLDQPIAAGSNVKIVYEGASEYNGQTFDTKTITVTK